MRRAFCVLAVIFSSLALLGAETGKDVGPIPLQPLGSFLYFTAARDLPGSVYSLNLLTGAISALYTRPRGQLYSFAFHPGIPEKLYLVNANDKKIFRVLWLRDHWSAEEVVYEHTTYVRDIAFGPEPSMGTPGPGNRIALFFSEACGACGNGKIYWLGPNGTANLFFEVRLEEVDGYWAGDFAFDEDGVLYLSSGNRVPAKIYRVQGGRIQTVYRHQGAIKGFVVRNGVIYFAGWTGSIYVLDLTTGSVEEILRNPRRFKWLSDVGFRD